MVTLARAFECALEGRNGLGTSFGRALAASTAAWLSNDVLSLSRTPSVCSHDVACVGVRFTRSQAPGQRGVRAGIVSSHPSRDRGIRDLSFAAFNVATCARWTSTSPARADRSWLSRGSCSSTMEHLAGVPVRLGRASLPRRNDHESRRHRRICLVRSPAS